MVNTTRYLGSQGCSPARESERSEPTKEFQARISCEQKNTDLVLEEIGRALRGAEQAGRDPLIVLDDLRVLAGSIAGLMKGLSRLLVDYPRRVTFWESSGYSEAFLSVMEGRSKPAIS